MGPKCCNSDVSGWCFYSRRSLSVIKLFLTVAVCFCLFFFFSLFGSLVWGDWHILWWACLCQNFVMGGLCLDWWKCVCVCVYVLIFLSMKYLVHCNKMWNEQIGKKQKNREKHNASCHACRSSWWLVFFFVYSHNSETTLWRWVLTVYLFCTTRGYWHFMKPFVQVEKKTHRHDACFDVFILEMQSSKHRQEKIKCSKMFMQVIDFTNIHWKHFLQQKLQINYKKKNLHRQKKLISPLNKYTRSETRRQTELGRQRNQWYCTERKTLMFTLRLQ